MGNLRAGGIVSLPIIDLRRGRDGCSRAVLDAGKEMGLFQVVNHGVAEQAMRDVAALCHEFFALPEADKAAFYSEDNDKTNRYFSGSTYETGGDKYWIDCLRLGCTIPVGSSTRDWPDKPNNFRQVVEKFAVQTRSMGMELLRLLAEGMGLRTDYFDGDLGGTDVILGINHYPACPDPTTMIGLPPHCDRNLLTLLLPNKVPGLQLLHNGECVHVEPLPNAFVVHTGLTLEDSCVLPISIYEADNPRIYNFILHVLLRVKIDVADLSKSILRWRALLPTVAMLKSREHRVVTNTTLARTAVGMFITPTKECLVTPAEEFLGDENPPRYRAVAYREFVRIHGTAATSVRTTNLRTH